MTPTACKSDHPLTLGHTRKGYRGVIEAVCVERGRHGVTADEIEKRLLELGFVEGASVEVLHEGAIGRDPIAVRVHGATIALRRSEANAIRLVDTRAP